MAFAKVIPRLNYVDFLVSFNTEDELSHCAGMPRQKQLIEVSVLLVIYACVFSSVRLSGHAVD